MANTVITSNNTNTNNTTISLEEQINNLFDTALEAQAVAAAEEAAKKEAKRKAEEARLKAEEADRRKVKAKAKEVCSKFSDISELEKYIEEGGEKINEKFGKLIDTLSDAYNRYQLIDEKEFENKFRYLNKKHMTVCHYWEEYSKFLKNAFFKKVWGNMMNEMNLLILDNEELYLIDNLLYEF